MTPQVHDTPGAQTLGHGSSKSYDSKLPAGPDLTEFYRERCAKLEKTLRLILKARQVAHAKAMAKEALK